jgi:cyclophilin family peptidyl-prolyl cis-trans isomerase
MSPMPSPRRRRLLAAAAAIVAMGAPLGAQRPTPAIDAQVLRASARLLAMADARAATSLIDSLLKAPAPTWLRQQALRTIGQVGDVSRAPLLRQALADPDTAVAADAAFALGLLRDAEALPALEAALFRPGSVQDEAAFALGRLGAPARGVLLVALGRSPTPALLLALAAPPVPVEAIAPQLTSADPALRWAAAYALTRSPSRDAAPVLLAALAGPIATDTTTGPRRDASDVRAGIARGLARNAVPDSLTTAAREALLRLVGDAHPHVRIAALRALATYPSAAAPVFREHITREPDANVRIALAQAAGPVLGPDDAAWEAMWAADTTTMVRLALVQGAGQHGITFAALDASRGLAWATSPEPRLRAAAATASIGAGEGSPLGKAGPFLLDPSPIVQRAAATALARALAAEPDSLLDGWMRQAASDQPDVWVRATALGAVARRAAARDVPGLLAAYRRAAGDALPAARHAALQALLAAWRRDSASFGPWADSLAALSVPADARAIALVRQPATREGEDPVPLTPLRAWDAARPGGRSTQQWEALVRESVIPGHEGRRPRATFVTTRGEIEVELLPHLAPLTVANLRQLASSGAYDDTPFHRVVPYFVAQGGDPAGTGSGGPGYSIRDELSRVRHDRGALAMAHAGPDTGGSQFYFAHAPQPHLDALHTVFGRVVRGLDVVDALTQWDRLLQVTIR